MKQGEVKKDLLDQLEKKKASSNYFIDMVNDYIQFWDIKTDLYKDIKKRGVMYTDVSSVGIPMQKNNPSVKELVNVNKQMLVILDKLDLNTKNVISGEDNDEM
ncbi:MAG: P27 family phage terminase small subunit [Clostridia bacterium]